MYTKSLIQQNLEIIKAKECFNERLTELMEKYNIKDNIFIFSNNSIKELTKGYFIIERVYDNMNDAIKNCNINTQGIRINENKLFTVGTIYNNIHNIPEDSNILDIENYNNIQ